MTDYSIVSVREALYREVEEVVDEERRGYDSVTEFAREAIRLHLQRVVRPNIEIIVRNRIKGAIYRRRFEETFHE